MDIGTVKINTFAICQAVDAALIYGDKLAGILVKNQWYWEKYKERNELTIKFECAGIYFKFVNNQNAVVTDLNTTWTYASDWTKESIG